MAGFDPRLLPVLVQLGQQIGGGFTSGLEHSRRKDREQARLDFQNKQLDEVKAHNQDQADAAALKFDQGVKDYKLRSETEARRTYDASARRETDRQKMTNEEAYRAAQLRDHRIRALTGVGMVPDQATLEDPSALDRWAAENQPRLMREKLRLATAPAIAGASARFENTKKLRKGEEEWMNQDPPVAPGEPGYGVTALPSQSPNAIPPSPEVQRKLREGPKPPNYLPLAGNILRNFSFNPASKDQAEAAAQQLRSLMPDLDLNWQSLIRQKGR